MTPDTPEAQMVEELRERVKAWMDERARFNGPTTTPLIRDLWAAVERLSAPAAEPVAWRCRRNGFVTPNGTELPSGDWFLSEQPQYGCECRPLVYASPPAAAGEDNKP